MTKHKTVSLKKEINHLLGIKENDTANHADECRCGNCSLADMIISAFLERIPEKKDLNSHAVCHAFQAGYDCPQEAYNEAIDQTIKNIEG